MTKSSGNGCSKIALHIINCAFVLIALAMIGHGVYLFFDVEEEVKSLGITAPKMTVEQHISLIVSGGLSLIFGVCGLVGILAGNYCATVLYTVLLSVDLILNMVFLIKLPSQTATADAAVSTQIRNTLVTHYGNRSSPYSLQLTQFIDDYQTRKRCCGWSGSSPVTINLFEFSPWFLAKNDISNSSKDSSTPPMTYPESCCTTHLTSGSRIPCTRATDIQVARRQNHIFAKDCLDYFSSVGLTAFAIGSAYMLLILILVMAIFCAILVLMGMPDQAPPPKRDASMVSRQSQQPKAKSLPLSPSVP